MECRLIRPQGLDEALIEREKHAGEALPIAGGQSLLVMLRNRLISPKALIDLEGLEELKGIRTNANEISLGAMTTFHSLLSSPEIKDAIPTVSQAAAKVASTAIRNLGTIGGNVCHNELGADLPPALLALNAAVELRSRRRTRKVPLAEFFRDFFETALEPDELLLRVQIPKLPRGAAGVYLKHAVSPEDLAIVGVAVVLIPDDKSARRISELRIGLGGVAPVPFRAAKAEKSLTGAMLNDEALREAGELAASEADPATDPHGTADYRRKMIKVFVRRAITAVLERIERAGYAKA
jgi:aerobic carbon-monoxide dehydrogenase medium subunit